MNPNALTLRVGIDVGGTFTDLAAVDTRSGERTIVKCPSTPQAPEAGVLNALDALFSRFPQPPRIQYLAHSTTIATNALLGQIHLELPRVVFLTTEGFRDVIEIGRQNRSEVYNLFVTRPKPLVAREDRLAVRERIDAHGRVLVPLQDAEIERIVNQVRRRNPGAVAIGLLHSYANDAHEARLAQAIALALPHVAVTCSAQVDREYREYERFSTTVVNAALLPIVQAYIDRLRDALRKRGIDVPLYIMQSNGGMISAERAVLPAALIESGPASGVIAAADLAASANLPRVLSFDMGGTTAKAGTIVDGAVQTATEFEAAGKTHSGRSVKGSGYPVRFPFVDLAEISAGGGTIAWIDPAGALRVGPLSAGADPGPACYGRSDLATVTDANVVVGRLNPQALAGGTFPIDARRARDAIAALAGRLGLSIEDAAAGIIDIVDAQMAKVLRIVTVERGLDPRDFALVAFGGNGPVHACALADALGMRHVIVPTNPGVFSAEGLLSAQLRTDLVHPLLREAQALADAELAGVFEDLEERGRQSLREQGVGNERIAVVRELDARYRGQSFELGVPLNGDVQSITPAFHRLHRQRYGYEAPSETVELVNARLSARAGMPSLPRHFHAVADAAPQPIERRAVYIAGRFAQTPVFRRGEITKFWTLAGPALIEQYDTVTYVPSGWQVRADGAMLHLNKQQ